MQSRSPQIIRTIDQLRRTVRAWRNTGEKIALTPTMGGLHDGHLSLIEIAKRHAGKTIASIFVNPTQFGENEDFDAYPRREAEDAEMLGGAGCDLIFAPSVDEMYPVGFATAVKVDRATDGLCGSRRPDHFQGVTTVVAKLLNQVQPDVAVFGEKDWQQLVTIKRMVRDLDLPVSIVSAPTLRESDGLAMSSRNRYLNAEQRKIAATLHKALTACARHIAQGSPVPAVESACKRLLTESGFGEIDYVEARRASGLERVVEFDPAKPSRLFGAAHLGRARLIDNVPITRTPS